MWVYDKNPKCTDIGQNQEVVHLKYCLIAIVKFVPKGKIFIEIVISWLLGNQRPGELLIDNITSSYVIVKCQQFLAM